MGRLQHKTALITGASSGIGLCIAQAFAREGAAVVLCARGLEKTQAAAQSIRDAGGEATALACDVASDASVDAMYAKLLAEVGAPEVLVNNAGYYEISRFLETSLDVYQQTIDVNYLGVIRLIKKVLPDMLQAGTGKIVNVASTAGKYGSVNQAHYNGSKHAVLGITRSLALEFAASGVNINAICPGFVETPMLETGMAQFAAAEDMDIPDVQERWLGRVPMGRFLQPEEITPLAIYLASEECAGMTGQALTISGGMVLV